MADDIFFSSLHCSSRGVGCWFILNDAGPVHVSFQLADHQQALLTLARQHSVAPADLGVSPPEGRGQSRRQATARNQLAALVSRRFRAYLQGEEPEFFRPLTSSPFLAAGSPFQLKVWREIALIPYGQTRTYGEIAERLGNRRLARAVGRACGTNPCPLVIPCHRVVGAISWGGFTGGGIELKKRLLALERANLGEDKP